MKILDKYIIKNFAWPFFFCTLLFICMFIVVDSLNSLDDFLKNNTPFKTILTYYLTSIPMTLSYILPSSVIISALYSLSTLNKHSEIIAMRSNGVSGYHILLPIFYVGMLLSIFLFIVNESITPKASIISYSIKQSLKDASEGDKTRSIDNVAILASNNQMVYARELALNTKSLYDVIVLKHHQDLSLATKTTADRAVYENGNWEFYNALQYSLDLDGNIIGKPTQYSSLKLGIKKSPEEFLKNHIAPEFMSHKQLSEYISNQNMTGFKTSNRLLVELHSKISRSFICLIMLIVSAPLALKTRRGGAMISLAVGFFVIIAYYATTAIFSALGKGAVLHPMAAAWLPNGIFFLVGLLLIRKYR